MLPNDVKQKIIEALGSLNPEKIILFGSYAHGNPGEESDIDLFVIKDMGKEQVRNFRLMTKKLLWQQFRHQNISFDVLVDSEERIKERIKIGDRFYEDIVKNGVVIYA
jgi:uncharacterized protein